MPEEEEVLLVKLVHLEDLEMDLNVRLRSIRAKMKPLKRKLKRHMDRRRR